VDQTSEPGVAAMDQLADLDALCARLAASPLLHGHEVLQLAPRDPSPIDLSRALAAALAKPTGTPPLRDLARGRRTAAIITTDATRATPSAALIGPVMEELARGGVSSDGVEVIIGVGAHRPATRDEIQRLLGEWAARLRVTNHDARAPDLVEIGKTSRGVPLLLNRRVAEVDLRIAFGQVEPHEFAGFTGGRKAILPSVAGYESIVRNHELDMLRAPAARPGVLDGNPIHEEMLAAARLARLDFIVNVALDRESRPVAVAAGDLQEAHEQLVGFLRRRFEVPAPARPPAVIVTGPGQPLDINLYQTIKALVGIEPLLDADHGGAGAPVVVLLSRCWDGGGSEEMFEPFLQARERLESSAGRDLRRADAVSQAALLCLERGYTIEKDESYFVARATPKCRAVIACCPGVPDERLRLLGWEPAADGDAAVARALQLSRGAADAGRGRDVHDDGSRLVVMCPRPQRALFV
jgi:lactate racemase